MIAFVRGTLAAMEDDCLIIDNNGVGLSVYAPVSMLKTPPALGGEVFLYTHLQVRDDGWSLFGFPEKEQLQVFRLLIAVSGIGAKTALSILNLLPVPTIAAAVSANDFNAFCAVSGVGKKTAQRLTLELKDKLSFAQDFIPYGGYEVSAAGDNDVLAALIQLGFSATESRSLLIKATQSVPEGSDNEALLMAALKLSAHI